MNKHIIISPHYDDAIFSLWGTIESLILSNEEVIVINVFTEFLNNSVHFNEVTKQYFAEDTSKNEINSNSLVDLYSNRKLEDQKILTELGITQINLEMEDAIFRGKSKYYPTETSLFSKPLKKDVDECISTINQLFKNKKLLDKKNYYYFPLGIGNHIDHQIINCIGVEKEKEDFNCIFYEDFPYNFLSELTLRKDSEFLSRYNIHREIFVDGKKKLQTILKYSTQKNWLSKIVSTEMINFLNYERLWCIKSSKVHN